MKKAFQAGLFALSALAACAGELDVARAALRDGLWEVARSRAARAEGDAAALVAVESYLREGRWADALAAIESWHEPPGELPCAYKAFALMRLGRGPEAESILAGRDFSDSAVAEFAAAIRAQVALERGDAAAAAAISADARMGEGGAYAKMTAAEIASVSGDAAAASRLWREAYEAPDADERVRTSAACRLGDIALLEKVYTSVESPDLKNETALALARLLMAGDRFDEGAALARRVVRENPSASGAKDVFLALADSYLERKAYIQAVETYREAMAAWPPAAREQHVREGCAWALRKLGRFDEAVAEFSKAAECAVDDDSRALALMERGDTLSEAGRGDESMETYRRVLAEYPGTPAGEKLRTVVELRELEARGRELYANLKFEEAQQAFSELAGRDATRKPKMDYLEMLCLYGQARDAEAEAKAKELASGSPDAKIRAASTLWLAKFEYNEKRWAMSRDLFASYATNMVPDGANAPEALLWASRAAYANNDFRAAIDLATHLATLYPKSAAKPPALLVQGEALAEISRLDEAIVVFERVIVDPSASSEEAARARLLRCDALFALGADNPARYEEALAGYESLPRSLESSFKAARTLEKLGRIDEAVDKYYGDVVCAYIEMRRGGAAVSEDETALFVRSAFRLADEFEKRSEPEKAGRMLRLAASGAGSAVAKEAGRRLERLKSKGGE